MSGPAPMVVLAVVLGLVVVACRDDADPTADDTAATDGASFCDVVSVPVAAELTEDTGESGVDLVVFLEPDASQSVIDVVRSALDEFEDAQISYVDQEAALEEARARLGDDLISGLRPENMPSSFRVSAEDREVLPRVAASVDGVPGVREVVPGSR